MLVVFLGMWVGSWVWRLPSCSLLTPGTRSAVLMRGVAADRTAMLGSVPDVEALPAHLLAALGIVDSACADASDKGRASETTRVAQSIYQLTQGTPRPGQRMVALAVMGLAIRFKYSSFQRVAFFLALLDLGEEGGLDGACHGMFEKPCRELELQEAALMGLWMRTRSGVMRTPNLDAAVAQDTRELARRCGEPMPTLLHVELTPRDGVRPPKVALVESASAR